jgi:ribulose-phosphate 3-epimerase
MRKVKIAPSILSADFARLGDEVAALEAAGSDYIHVDVMDGCFVPNLTIGQPVVAALRKATTLPLDVHLMIEQPDRHLSAFAAAGADLLTVHAEACVHLHRTVQSIRALGVRAGVALNPATPLEPVRWVLSQVDLVLVMSVNPGFGGQSFIDESLRRIATVREWIEQVDRPVELEVDGGVVIDNAALIAGAGADVLVSGTGIVAQRDRRQAIQSMRESADGAWSGAQ